MKKLLILFMGLSFSLLTMAQFPDSIYVTGWVHNSTSGANIVNKHVQILADSTNGWLNTLDVYTDQTGMFYAYVPVTPPTGYIMILVTDCNDILHRAIRSYDFLTNIDDTIWQEFYICDTTQCQAAFTSTLDPGDEHTVHFQDASSGNQLSYFWNFGDANSGSNNTSTLQNPTHTFSSNGIFEVHHSIRSADSLCFHYTYQTLVIGPNTGSCNAAFTYSADSLDPLTIHYTDQSTGNPVFWYWESVDHGNTYISNLQNPTFQYSEPGMYVTKLTIQGADSTCLSFISDTVWVDVTQCEAMFTYYVDSTSNLGIHFIDESYWNATSVASTWTWSFGDSTYSNDRFPVHFYTEAGTYQVCLTITGNGCNDTYCSTIVVGNGGSCESYFLYNAVNLDVSFAGYMATGSATSYSWYFGDGNTGQGQTVTHSYSQPGSYSVQLSTLDSNGCQFNSIQYVTVGDTTLYHQVYGQVYAGTFPLGSGMVMIFSNDTSANYFPYFDVSYIDSSGVYYFAYVPDGVYYIWAIPFTTDYLPTYFGDVVYWEQATTVTLGEPNNPYDIHLVPSPGLINGPGIINGQINSGKSMDGFIDKVSMLIKDEQGTVRSHAQVNSSGDFNFPSLAYGTYYLVPELPGCPGDAIKVILSPSSPTVDVIMTFSGGHILGTGDEEPAGEVIMMYPNPVREQLNLSIGSQASSVLRIEVLTITGQVVYSATESVGSGQTKLVIPFSNLKEGMYTLRICSEDGINIVKKVIKSR